MRRRLLVLCLGLGMVVGCKSRNPAVCCNTPVECDDIGFDEITPCEGVKVCLEGECVSPQCVTSAECADPAPYCVDQTCAAACTKSEDCVGIPGMPDCAPDGTCVACLDDGECADPAAAVCDDASHTCRPCTEDTECASGICLAAEGVCAATEDAVYLSMGGADTGECVEAAPCVSLAYALSKITATRRVLRLVGLDYLANGGFNLAQDVYVDAPGTRIQKSGTTGPVIVISNTADVTLEGIRVISPTDKAINVTGATVLLRDVEVSGGGSLGGITTNGSLDIVDSEIRSTGVSCVSTHLGISRSHVQTSTIRPDGCDVAIDQTRFDTGETLVLDASFSRIRFDNNLVVRTDSAEGLRLVSSLSASAVRYNTFVKTTPAADGASALSCTGAAVVATSNIFAWRTTDPVAGTVCDVRFSLFDLDATSVPGGNDSQASSDIFADAAGADYHPGSASRAREMSEPGLDVVVDFDGAVRPQPAATTSDIGALEVP